MEIINANDILRQRYISLPLNKKFERFIGKLPKNEQWSMLLHGVAGSGKSTYSLILAKELVRFGNVLYGNFEEKMGPTLKEKLLTAKIRTNNIHFLKDNTEETLWRMLDTNNYRYCIIDSISIISKTTKQVFNFFAKIKEHPNISFIIISHSKKNSNNKKDSDYKGISEIRHLVDIEQNIIDGKVFNRKNRFLGKNCEIADGYDCFRNEIVRKR